MRPSSSDDSSGEPSTSLGNEDISKFANKDFRRWFLKLLNPNQFKEAYVYIGCNEKGHYKNKCPHVKERKVKTLKLGKLNHIKKVKTPKLGKLNHINVLHPNCRKKEANKKDHIIWFTCHERGYYYT